MHFCVCSARRQVEKWAIFFRGPTRQDLTTGKYAHPHFEWECLNKSWYVDSVGRDSINMSIPLTPPTLPFCFVCIQFLICPLPILTYKGLPDPVFLEVSLHEVSCLHVVGGLA